VVADVMVPTADGFELTRRLRIDERTAATKVILLSARGLSEGMLEGFAVGADEYLVKPFDPPALLERIREVLARPAVAARPA
jgi:DNA-binding response OmpR family regulator